MSLFIMGALDNLHRVQRPVTALEYDARASIPNRDKHRDARKVGLDSGRSSCHGYSRMILHILYADCPPRGYDRFRLYLLGIPDAIVNIYWHERNICIFIGVGQLGLNYSRSAAYCNLKVISIACSSYELEDARYIH
ncbi:hypothetical protein P692DRAFT_20819773 [Suillus brevipes Sb2]|nr:hypothetical protein P692DRAFT_20819773 [Suillus brevipes Sb2]